MIWLVIGLFATQVIVVSQPCWPGRPVKKVVVLANPISLDRPLRTTRPPLDRVQLGFVGRYHLHKGMDLLLDWFTEARAAGLDVRLIMRGRPDADHPLYWPRICGRIRSEGLEPFVADQGWQLNRNVYDDIDFLLVPSELPDPAPLVILEAMSAGVVVIGFPSGGIPQLIPYGTGSLARTAAEFVAALQSYIETPGLYEQVRAAAYQHVRVAHDPQTLAKSFASICRSTLPSARRDARFAKPRRRDEPASLATSPQQKQEVD